MLDYMIIILIAALGMCIGSFMNVCIYRIPSPKSIMNPSRSICPSCNTPIRSYDNIPVLSYMWLKGRCRHCHAPISLRYPLVEVMGGFLALGIFLKFGLTLEGLIYFAFTAALLVITFIDIDHRIIPDVITLPFIPIGLLSSLALPAMSFSDSVLGLLVGGGSLLLIAWSYHLITKKEGMGGGDIKLLAMIGTFVGWKGALFTIFAASFLGLLASLPIMLITHKDLKSAIPFGPFIAAGAISFVFFGPEFIRWYINMVT